MLKSLTGDVWFMPNLFSAIGNRMYEIVGSVCGRERIDAGQADSMAAEINYMMENSIRIMNYSGLWRGIGDTERLAVIDGYLERHRKICDSLMSRKKGLIMNRSQAAEIKERIEQANRIIEHGILYKMNKTAVSARGNKVYIP